MEGCNWDPILDRKKLHPSLLEPDQSRESVYLNCGYKSLGDRVCFIAAARHFARAHPDMMVSVSHFQDLVAAYGDKFLNSGTQGREMHCNPERRHRKKERSEDHNYLGTYMAELGLTLDGPPALELPRLDPHPELAPQSYVCLQPYAGFAGTPANREEFFTVLVESVRKALPQWPIICVGKPSTRRDIRGVTYDHLGDHISVLQIVQHAGMVFTPRSASAHIASAYGVPSFVWVPQDGEDWHLDYPRWPHCRVAMHATSEELRMKILEFLDQVL